jgi:hypothetical protein
MKTNGNAIISTSALLLAAALGAALFVAGCASHEGAYAPVNTQTGNIETKARFVLLDPKAQEWVTCSGLQERTLEDGRLEVTANIRNRVNRRLEMQVNCVFKNESGFATEDEAPFRTLILTENSQESVKFISANNQARTYTVRVRQAR